MREAFAEWFKASGIRRKDFDVAYDAWSAAWAAAVKDGDGS